MIHEQERGRTSARFSRTKTTLQISLIHSVTSTMTRQTQGRLHRHRQVRRDQQKIPQTIAIEETTQTRTRQLAVATTA